MVSETGGPSEGMVAKNQVASDSGLVDDVLVRDRVRVPGSLGLGGIAAE